MKDIFLIYFSIIPVLAICSGIFGSFILWEKNSFFVDTFSHSILLPFSLLIFFNLIDDSYIFLFVSIFSVFFVLFFYYLKSNSKKYYSTNTSLITVSFFCLSLSFFINSISRTKIDIMMLISGDIFFINKADIFFLYIFTGILLVFVYFFYEQLLLKIISEDIAKIQNRFSSLINILFMILQAIFIAAIMRAVGVIFVSAILLMPPIIARPFSNRSKNMIILSSVICAIVMIYSSFLSLFLNTQFISTSILAYCVLFFVLSFLRKFATFIMKKFLCHL